MTTTLETKPIVINCYNDIWNTKSERKKVKIGEQVTISGKTGIIIDAEYQIPYNEKMGIIQIKEPNGKKHEYIIHENRIGPEVSQWRQVTGIK